MTTDLGLLALLVLGSFRLWRFLALDTITERPREWFFDRCPPTPERSQFRAVWQPELRKVLLVSVNPPPLFHVKRLGQWVACPWCAGAWIAAATVGVVNAMVGLPLPALWWAATSAGVGLLGSS